MESNEKTAGAIHLVLIAGSERALRRAHLGPEGITGGLMGSADLFLAFLKHFPEASRSLATDLGTDTATITERLLAIGETKEEPKQPSPSTVEALKGIGREEVKPRFSIPVSQAIKLARQEQKSTGKDPGPPYLLSVLLASDCESRQVLLDLGGAERLEYALGRLREVRADPMDYGAMAWKQTNALVDAMWPQILKEEKDRRIAKFGRDPYLESREKSYAKNPTRYEQSLDLKNELSQLAEQGKRERYLAGVYLLAAGNEARIRRAPYVTTDHMLLVLLQPITSTWKFLSSRGVDPSGLLRMVNEHLPKFEEGPRWPDNSRALSIGIPSPVKIRFKKKLPEGVDIESLSKEQVEEYIEKLPTMKSSPTSPGFARSSLTSQVSAVRVFKRQASPRTTSGPRLRRSKLATPSGSWFPQISAKV